MSPSPFVVLLPYANRRPNYRTARFHLQVHPEGISRITVNKVLEGRLKRKPTFFVRRPGYIKERTRGGNITFLRHFPVHTSPIVDFHACTYSSFCSPTALPRLPFFFQSTVSECSTLPYFCIILFLCLLLSLGL